MSKKIDKERFWRFTLFTLALTGISAASDCFTQDITWGHQSVVGGQSGVTGPDECQNLCYQLVTDFGAECSNFTWHAPSHPNFPNFCYLYNLSQDEMDSPEGCESCTSGPWSCMCSKNQACNIEEGNSNLLGFYPNIQKEEQCQEKCLNRPGCSFYTWFSEESLYSEDCYLFSSCDSVDSSCVGCHTGTPDCGFPSGPTTAGTSGTSSSTTPGTGSTATTEKTTPTWTSPTSSPGTSSTGTTPSPELPEHVVMLTDRGSGVFERAGEIYSGQPSAHITIASPPDDRAYHTLNYFNNYVMMCGGGSYSETRTSCLQLDLTGDREWYFHSNYAKPRIGHSSVVLSDRIYLVGGYHDLTTQYKGIDASYNWMPGNSLLEDAYLSCVANSPTDDTFVVIAGSVAAYNITSVDGTFLPNLAHPRLHHSCLYLPEKEGILVVGGSARDSSGYVAETEFYSFKDRSWESWGNITPRDGPGLAALENGRILAFGGSNSDEDGIVMATNIVEEYLPETNTWITLENEEDQMFSKMFEVAANMVPSQLFFP